MIWIILALLGAFSTSLTTIFAKIGIKNVKSNFATTYRTLIVIICCLIMCLITGNINKINELNYQNWIFLVLSGLATGFSWIFYYRALKTGNINKVVPIDKSSFVLTSILFLIFFFDDTTNNGNILTICMLFLSISLMLIGTLFMINKVDSQDTKDNKWLLFALLSSFSASLVSLFVKIGLKGISSDLGTLFRTIIVFIFALTITCVKKEYKDVANISKRSWIFLTLSGVATGGAWLFEYYALNVDNVNPIAVNSIGKLSILLTMLFSFVILKEKFTIKSLLGLALLTIGIIIIIIFSL